MIQLNLLSAKNIQTTVKATDFKVNFNLNDKWNKIENNALLSFQNVLCSLTYNKKEYFIFFDSLLIQSNKGQINLYYNQEYFVYEQNDKNKNELKKLNQEYSKLKKDILLKTFQINENNNASNIANLLILKQKAYRLKAQIYFSLFACEEPWK
ncbi:MSC_0621 family F1-like ATPase epsilon subunit [Mycoplasmopsis synoviae]|uniref:MSC_0621 family F1-like ATPase epsilon subunit n=1 Tax=Mycoplasmopsis synoviae TaxID=2109 RepID=UPI000376F441|nr:hypothetical protein [Mycoplasmopsis synoviae]AKB11199.1 hypothetical protein VY93_02530 [Mycoplasmopsis synoviae ATCC 25204]